MLNVIGLLFSLSIHHAPAEVPSADLKPLRAGMVTLEALGPSKDDNLYAGLRVIACADDVTPFDAAAPETAPFVKVALVLSPGSRVRLRRTILNAAYVAETQMREYVDITCER